MKALCDALPVRHIFTVWIKAGLFTPLGYRESVDLILMFKIIVVCSPCFYPIFQVSLCAPGKIMVLKDVADNIMGNLGMRPLSECTVQLLCCEAPTFLRDNLPTTWPKSQVSFLPF